MELPNALSHLLSFDYFVRSPTTHRGDTYILPFIERFSRHMSTYAVIVGDFTAAGIADILVHDYIEHYGHPKGGALLLQWFAILLRPLGRTVEPLGSAKLPRALTIQTV